MVRKESVGGDGVGDLSLEDQIWKRDPDETLRRGEGERPRWYERFVQFARMGAGRTVYAVYELETKERGYRVKKELPTDWRLNAERYRWHERARVYDLAREARWRAEMIDQTRHTMRNALRVLSLSLARVGQATQYMDVENAKWNEVINGVKTLSSELRMLNDSMRGVLQEDVTEQGPCVDWVSVSEWGPYGADKITRAEDETDAGGAV